MLYDKVPVRLPSFRLLALAIGLIVAFVLTVSAAADARAATDDGHKVYVCKYVGTPGEDERLQTGQNPIEVSVHAIGEPVVVGAYFNDAQGRSFVLGFVPMSPEPTRLDCPGGTEPSPSPSATTEPSSEPSVEPTPSNSPSPQPSATPSPTQSATPTPEPTPSSSVTPSTEPTPVPSVSPTAPAVTLTPRVPTVTAPPTDTATATSVPTTGPDSGMLFWLSLIGTVAYLLIFKFKRPYRT